MASGTSWLLSAAESARDQQFCANALHAGGARAGDRLAIISTNHPTVISVVLGALRSGIVPVMVNAGLLPAERAVILEDCSPAIVLDGVEQVRAFVASGAENGRLHGSIPTLAATPLGRPMHYTSGTTGRPKGVWAGVLDEQRAHALHREEREQWGFCADDRNLVVSPLFHSAPLRFSMGTLMAGGSVVVLEKFTPSSAATAIVETHPTTAFMAPAHVQRLFDDGPVGLDLGSFRLLAHAGAPCPPSLKLQLLERFPRGSVWEFYGATEGQFTVCSTEDWERSPASVGRARSHRRLTIDPDSNAIWCEVPDYARFEYFGDAARTAAAWQGNSFSVFDIGRLDQSGYLYLDGRRDDLIITGGVNVYPLECENALRTLDGVRDVAVYPVDDTRWGQKVCAAIVRSDSSAGRSLTADTVRSFAAAELAPYKRPKDIVFVEEIPHSPTGKVRRSRLAADLGLSS
jgi:long-chain acyl-CoA synthetase